MKGTLQHKRILTLSLKIVAVWAFLVLFLTSAHAQFYNGSQLTFGKNRVQHQKFNWQYLRAEQYDVYYYPTGRALAQYVFYKTPEFIAEIEHLLNYTSKKKLQIIVYNTQADFRESNFAYDYEDFYNHGGVALSMSVPDLRPRAVLQRLAADLREKPRAASKV